MNDTTTAASGQRRPRSRAALITALIGAGLCLVAGLVLSQLATFGAPPPTPDGWYTPTWSDLSTGQILNAAAVVLLWILFPAFLVTATVLGLLEAARSRRSR